MNTNNLLENENLLYYREGVNMAIYKSPPLMHGAVSGLVMGTMSFPARSFALRSIVRRSSRVHSRPPMRPVLKMGAQTSSGAWTFAMLSAAVIASGGASSNSAPSRRASSAASASSLSA